MSSKQHKTRTDCELLAGCPSFMLFAHSHFHFASEWEKVNVHLSFDTDQTLLNNHTHRTDETLMHS